MPAGIEIPPVLSSVANFDCLLDLEPILIAADLLADRVLAEPADVGAMRAQAADLKTKILAWLDKE